MPTDLRVASERKRKARQAQAQTEVTILLVFVIITLIMLVLLVADQSDGPLGSLTSQVGLGNSKLAREIRTYRNSGGVPDPTGEVMPFQGFGAFAFP
jgi:hypothetical protein